MTEEPSRDMALARAEEALRAAEPLAANDPMRPRYHFLPRAGWMNDPNGPVYHRGWYHLFYQTNPFGELAWGAERSAVQWGHARSRDLMRWEHLPIAIWPSTERGEEHCWSGSCVVRDDGRPMIFYTSIGPTHRPKDSAEQWLAVGDEDLIRWRKHPSNPVVAGKVFGGVRLLDWRDPFVFREGGAWRMVTGGHRENGRGCVSMFGSPDLERWTFEGILFDAEEENCECPALFRLGDRWTLLYSPHAPVRYFTGQMDWERTRFVPEVSGRFDYGRFLGFYAATVMPDPQGRVVLWAWMHSANRGRGWNGCMLLPRELRLLPDGRIEHRPVDEAATLRGERIADGSLRLTDGAKRYPALGGCAELAMRVTGATAWRYGVRMLSAMGDTMAEVACDTDGVEVLEDRVPAVEIGGTNPLDLRVFADRSLLEVYLNGRASVSRWMETERVDSFELYAQGGSVEVEGISLWRIEPPG